MAAKKKKLSKSPWRPIETAPKDTIILLSDGGMMVQGFWERDGWMTGFATSQFRFYLQFPATHWMPLLDGPGGTIKSS